MASQDLETALRPLLVREALPAAFMATVTHHYLPLAAALARLCRGSRVPPVVGICGPQGSGKSTLALFLEEILRLSCGLRAARLALDDLYLPLEQRQQLSERVHPLLRTRGVPGTHEVALGIGLIRQLRGGADTVAMPRFDKALDTRVAPLIFHGPADLVIFEGWCVGAEPQPETALAEPVNALEREEDGDGRWRRYVNAQLAGPYRDLFALLDRLVMLVPPDFECVYRWRALQEDKLRARTGGGMDEAALRRFIQHYERITQHMLGEMPARADCVLELDVRHTVVTLRGELYAS